MTGPIAFTAKANNGNYSFPNLPAGTYTITATDTPSTIENGHVQTTLPSPTRTVVNASNFQNVDIGFFENGVIKGKVFNDLNGNGVKESGENGLLVLVVAGRLKRSNHYGGANYELFGGPINPPPSLLRLGRKQNESSLSFCPSEDAK